MPLTAPTAEEEDEAEGDAADIPSPHRWALVSRNHLMSWGVFASGQATWDFADQRGLPRDALEVICWDMPLLCGRQSKMNWRGELSLKV